MVIRFYGRPDRVALAIIAAIKGGKFQTKGQWQDVVVHLQHLPSQLRLWTFDRIREIMGDAAVDYLVSRMIPPRPRPVPAGVR